MAIYRPQRPRWRLAAGALVVGTLIGLVLGLVLGSEETDPTEAGGQIRAGLASASSILEVTQVEYAESVGDGGVVQEAEYEGSLDALDRSRAEFNEAAGGLEAIDPDRAERIRDAYRDLKTAMQDAVPPEEVEAMIAELERLLATD